MIISDKYRFAFIHIPKCAGSSVRKALAPYDDYKGWFEGRIDFHPDFGELDFVHMPLATLEKVLPKEYEKLVSYDAYALIRDPMARFQSAFAQHIKMYRGVELAQMQEQDMECEIESVTEKLKLMSCYTEPSLIHFTRQSDFIINGEIRCVEHVFPVTRINLLFKSLSQRIGKEIILEERINETKILKFNSFNKQIFEVGQIVKNALPKAIYRPIQLTARRLLMQPIHNELLPPFKKKSTIRFVECYYKEDFVLYHEALKATKHLEVHQNLNRANL